MNITNRPKIHTQYVLTVNKQKPGFLVQYNLAYCLAKTATNAKQDAHCFTNNTILPGQLFGLNFCTDWLFGGRSIYNYWFIWILFGLYRINVLSLQWCKHTVQLIVCSLSNTSCWYVLKYVWQPHSTGKFTNSSFWWWWWLIWISGIVFFISH